MDRPAIPLAGGTLDRAAHRRTDAGWLAAARGTGRGFDLATGQLVPVGDRPTSALLGVGDDGEPVWLLEGDAGPGLRAAMATADAAHQGLLAYAAHLAFFHAAHRFCGRCGQPTELRDGGFLVRCPEGHDVYPRTDPVVIMLVEDGEDRILMGRQPAWPPGRWSALAGFVEPGEALESAVAREVREEAGIEVARARYRFSQPWPFPGSLMLGFRVAWAGGEAAVQDDELEAVRWFDRDEVERAAREDVGWDDADPADRLLLPPSMAIARHLVDDWLARA